MNALLPVLGAVLQATSFTLDKVVLSVRHVGYRGYLGIGFPIAFFFTLLLAVLFRPPIGPELFSGYLPLLLTVSILINIGTNIIFYRALEADQLGEVETIGLLRNLPVILLAGILFADERNAIVLGAAMAAAIAVVVSHWDHGRMRLRPETSLFLLWIVLVSPWSAIATKILLEAWSPIMLEAVRVGILSLVFFWAYRASERAVHRHEIPLIVFTSGLTAIAWVLYFTSYQRLGVVYTVLIFSLQPLLVYVSSVLFLKEQHSTKKTIGFVVVLVAIIVAQLARTS